MILFIRDLDRMNFMIQKKLHDANKNLCTAKKAIPILFFLFVFESLKTFKTLIKNKIHALKKHGLLSDCDLERTEFKLFER